MTMRGYSDIMSSTESGTTQLSDNGRQLPSETAAKRTLWQPRNEAPSEPDWHLYVSVLKNGEGRGDCPSRRFSFKSMHHLTHAANQLEAAFGGAFEIKKCGFTSPDAMGGRVNDGRSENVTIEYDSDAATVSWKDFLGRLKELEDEWEHEAEF